MDYKLSICIPTYNRAIYLKQLLDCILNQLKDIEENTVEICVSDNASTDNTQEILQKYQQEYNNITYFRWDKNMGADMNYLKVVEIAHGKYCWFFGSDDLMVDGAIKKMLEEIKENHDIYLCNTIQCDINMKEESRNTIFKENIKTTVFSFEHDNDILKYFKSMIAISGLFSYLSGIIFKKSQWNSIDFDESFIGTAYSHSYILLSLLKKNITLKYIYDFLVMSRGGNDSFFYNSIANRTILDLDGYKKLFNKIFDYNKNIKNYYYVIMGRFMPYKRMIHILYISGKEEREKMFKYTDKIYNKKLLEFGLLLFPFIYAIYKIIKK